MHAARLLNMSVPDVLDAPVALVSAALMAADVEREAEQLGPWKRTDEGGG